VCVVNGEAPGPAPPHRAPPTGYVGGWVPWTVVLAKSADMYAALQDFEAFPTGVRFTLRARFRPGTFDPIPAPGKPSLLPGTPGGPSFAVTFSDGRRGKSEPGSADDGGVILQYFRGSGGSDEWWMAYWLSPLPPPGPLTWHVAWPEMSTPGDSVVVDSSELIEAAEDARALW
jgi:hypothetical protein